MNFLDDVPGIIRKSVKHFVVCEASYIQPPTFVSRELTVESYSHKPLLTTWLSFP